MRTDDKLTEAIEQIDALLEVGDGGTALDLATIGPILRAILARFERLPTDAGPRRTVHENATALAWLVTYPDGTRHVTDEKPYPRQFEEVIPLFQIIEH